MGMAVPTYHTADMVRALPDDGNTYELVYGQLLVTPAPRPWHEEVVARVFEALRDYVRAEPVGHVFGSRSDISWGPDSLVQPDVFVVPLEQARSLEWARMKDLLLVVEVLSPSSGRADRFTKRRLYQEQRIPLYWVLDPEGRSCEVWTPDARFPAVEGERAIWQPEQARKPFVLDLAELYRPL